MTLGYVPIHYYPVCHSPYVNTRIVRLACLIHAASVHPELGSNSTKKYVTLCGVFSIFIERNTRFRYGIMLQNILHDVILFSLQLILEKI